MGEKQKTSEEYNLRLEIGKRVSVREINGDYRSLWKDESEVIVMIAEEYAKVKTGPFALSGLQVAGQLVRANEKNEQLQKEVKESDELYVIAVDANDKLKAENAAMREGLIKVGLHHQGGHSEIGAFIKELLK